MEFFFTHLTLSGFTRVAGVKNHKFRLYVQSSRSHNCKQGHLNFKNPGSMDTLCQEHITDIKWCKSELQYQAIKQNKLIQMQNFQWLMLRVKVAKCNKNSERR